MTPFAIIVLCFAAASLTEPNTGVNFEMAMDAGGKALSLTGVDRRKALGRDAYAVAHYFDAAGGAPEDSAADRLKHFIDTPAHKVLVFHGVYKSVPAYGIRRSWNKHFKDLGIPPREDFVEAFQDPFERGQRLYFIASPEGRLEVRHDDRLIGEWNDPTLVQALWAMSLGPTTEVVERQNLAARNTASENAAGESGAESISK